MTRSVGIYIYPEVEVLDFAGPFEVFNTASRVFLRTHPEKQPPFEIKVIGATMQSVLARGSLEVLPHTTITQTSQLDVLIIPGGIVDLELGHVDLVEWIQLIHRRTELTASVCTGSFLLAQAGLLDGLQATTHWDDLEDFRIKFPNVEVLSGQRWVEQGKIITSAGISAGIDMSLHLVARLEGENLAERTARQLDYSWNVGT